MWCEKGSHVRVSRDPFIQTAHSGYPTMLEKENLIKLARTPMPFGKYAGRMLIDLPEEYLLWFDKKGWPNGELGQLLQLCLALKIEGLDSVVKPLKRL